MFCRYCGKELADNAFMCPNCGSPTGSASVKQELSKEEPVKKEPSLTGLSVVGFILSLVAFVTGIIFGAFFFEYAGAALLLYILSATTILPGLAAISIGAYLSSSAWKSLANPAKAFAIVSVVLPAVVLVFLFIGGSVIVTGNLY